MTAATQQCTECGRVSEVLKTRSWSAERGELIAEGEELCPACAAKRGCKTLREIERDMLDEQERDR